MSKEVAKEITNEKDQKKKKKSKKSFYMRMHRLLAGIVRLFLRVHITGKENIPKTGGVVVCANHVSLTDPVSIAAAFPRQLTFLAKKELFRIPVLRSVIRAFGAYPLDRHGDVGAMRHAIAMASKKEDECAEVGEQMVLIFPQGTRCQGKNPADTRIKNGAGMIAFHAGAPMLPVCIKMKNNRYRLFRRIDVIVGKPLLPDDLGFSSGGSHEFAVATGRTFDEICRLGGFEKSVTPDKNNPHTPSDTPAGDKK